MDANQLLEKLKSKTIEFGGCWLYQSAPANEHGYCKVQYNGRRIYIHRLSAHIHWGFDLDSPMQILHRAACTHTSCWNPEHLYEGTHAENMQDKILTGTNRNQNQNKTHCPKGHEFTPENTYIGPTRGERRCRICRNEQNHVR